MTEGLENKSILLQLTPPSHFWSHTFADGENGRGPSAFYSTWKCVKGPAQHIAENSRNVSFHEYSCVPILRVLKRKTRACGSW